MTNNFKNMLYLFGAGANGAGIRPLEEINIDYIRKLSVDQGIWTIVFPVLSKVCDAAKYQQEFFTVISKGIRRREFTLDIIKKFEKSGVKCCILKGISVSGLYKNPDCRISGDTDILINSDDEEKVKAILIENGYTVENREKNDHHLKAHHDIGGLLEVHVKLYSAITEKILFNDLQMYDEPWDTIEINGENYYTLGVNDNLIYLTAHYIKHFINEGGGVRQMMDLLLYMEANKDRINFEKYNRVLKQLKYDKLIDVVKSIGGKYFGFDYEVKNEELADRILSDTEIGGIFGQATDMRNSFYYEYCKKRTVMAKSKAALFMILKNESGFLKKLFPPQNILVTMYGYKYARHKLLVPLGWAHRYINLIIRRIKPKKSGKGTSEFDERMRLMRELEMID